MRTCFVMNITYFVHLSSFVKIHVLFIFNSLQLATWCSPMVPLNYKVSYH